MDFFFRLITKKEASRLAINDAGQIRSVAFIICFTATKAKKKLYNYLIFNYVIQT